VELTVDNPQTGTKLRLESDRQLERQQGDSVMRVQAQGQDGGQVFDAAYVECDAQEAELIATVLRETQYQSPQMQDRVAQEVQATFASKLSGRDAAQIAQIVARSSRQAVQTQLGIGDEAEAEQAINRLVERFSRAASKRREPASGNGAQQSPRATKSSQQSPRASQSSRQQSARATQAAR
jgi:hypothetical protein